LTSPSGIPRAAFQFYGAARGAVAQRASTADFYSALRNAGATFGAGQGGLTFGDVNAIRSAAAQERNSAERFQRMPDANAIDASQISRAPYGRSLEAQASMPIYQVGINLTTINKETGESVNRYTTAQFTGQLPATKGELLAQVQQDAQALADNYDEFYIDHSVIEIRAF
jgi:hypothetical protein